MYLEARVICGLKSIEQLDMTCGCTNQRMTTMVLNGGFSTDDARRAGLVSAYCRLSFDPRDLTVANKFVQEEKLRVLDATVSVEEARGLIRITHTWRLTPQLMSYIDEALENDPYKGKIKYAANQRNAGRADFKGPARTIGRTA